MTANANAGFGALLFGNDPIVIEALRLNGLDMASLPWPYGTEDDECVIKLFGSWGTETIGDDVRPFVIPKMRLFFDGEAFLTWNNPTPFLRYDVDTLGGIITLPETVISEAALAGLKGQRLDSMVDVPGADQMRIIEAVNSSAFRGDPTDLRMSVERAS